MARYERLTALGLGMYEADLAGMGFFDKLTEGDAEDERALQQKRIRDNVYAIPSTELTTEIFSQLQNSKGYHPDSRNAQQQQKLQGKQDIENGNPNVCAADPLTRSDIVAICSHSSTATGASLQEQHLHGGGGRGGSSQSGRWAGRYIEERSGRWRTVGCDSNQRDNSASGLENGSIDPSAPLSRPLCGHWTPSLQRASSHRDREPALDHQSRERFSSQAGTQPQHTQPRDKQSLHSPCIDGRNCERSCERSPKESSPREGQLSGGFAQERGPILQRSSSAREAPGLKRSSSTRDTAGQRSEMVIENWRDHPASKSAHVSDRTKHRVSFSLTEHHEVEAQKLREKFREPTAPCKNTPQAKPQSTNQQPLRYNYEQPGFVERDKENICAGKAYTIYGVKELKDCPKGSSGRHHQLVRAFSLRENGSTYAKMPRAYSVNAGGRHLMPMECDTCGNGGVGIVFLGLPGDDANFCKSCKSSAGSGWSCGESKPPKKKKSIMHYCRKILRLPQKPR